ncbi:hypothetical protein ACGVWS_06805 [Enterobacteriaceae bacterium LUAb1]
MFLAWFCTRLALEPRIRYGVFQKNTTINNGARPLAGDIRRITDEKYRQPGHVWAEQLASKVGNVKRLCPVKDERLPLLLRFPTR